MSEPTPAPSPAPSPEPAPSPAPVAAQRPEWAPETFWDPAANTFKPEFGQHYADLSTFHKTKTEAEAALKARKPEDIKIEVKLPDAVKVPEGMQIKIDEKDPRVPVIREMALKNGWTQEQVNDLVALDAQQKIADHAAEMARVAEEDKKLGEKGNERKAAVSNWAKALKEKNELSAEEYGEVSVLTATAAGVTLLEKFIAKSNGTVPGTTLSPPPPPPQKSQADTIWPGGFKAKAS